MNFYTYIKKKPERFQSSTFKISNGKINDIKYDPKNNAYEHGKGNSLDMYLNANGLSRVQNPDIEKNFTKLSQDIIDFKMKYFLTFSSNRRGALSK